MTRKIMAHEESYGATVVVVTPEEIQACDLSKVLDVFSRLDAKRIPAERNSVRFVVPMTVSEKRELVEIPEVRIFFRKLVEEVDSLFYWLDPNDNAFWLIPFYLQENSKAFFAMVLMWPWTFRACPPSSAKYAKDWRNTVVEGAFLP